MLHTLNAEIGYSDIALTVKIGKT